MATSVPSREDFSYTKMDSADLEAIGAHCQFEYCHQLDFLPFRCDSCKSTFCLDHRSELAHQCAHAGEWAKNRRKNSLGKAGNGGLSPPPGLPGLAPTQCSETQCRTIINTMQNIGSRCDNCHRQYCLKHRFREEHDCSRRNIISPLASHPDSSLERQAEMMRDRFSRLRSWGKNKQEALMPKPKRSQPTSRAAQLAALSTLKRNAKGDASIPAEKRIYLHVEAEAARTTSKPPKEDLYFHQDWKVGRMLDEAAKKLQVANVNNRVETEEQRLHVYHVEAGRVLGYSETLGSGLQSGNTVVLLKGVGPAVPDLIEI